MDRALCDAKLDLTDIGYINAHGTSTPLGDQAETVAIKRVFGDHARKLSISSTKSQLGHLLGASGGVELVLTVLALRDSVIPPTINLENPDPACDLDYTPNQPRSRELRGRHVEQFWLWRSQCLGDRRPAPQRHTLASPLERNTAALFGAAGQQRC